MSQVFHIFNYISDFLKVYLPLVRGRDADTITSYRITLSLYVSSDLGKSVSQSE